MDSSQHLVRPSHPVVLIGDYEKCLDYVITNIYENWIIPNLLWIDYRVIPLFSFYQTIQDQENPNSSLFFLEIFSFEDYNSILGSNKLTKLIMGRFSTLIVNYPHFCTHNYENWIYLKKLTKFSVVIVIVPKDLFPAEECTRVVVDST